MKILNSIPKNDGFYMPAEFHKHRGCILIWPERADSWQYGAIEARKAFVNVIKQISKSEKVTVCVSFEQYDNARKMLPSDVRVVEMSSDDSWARDYMPTFLINKNNEIRGVDWGFNAWGGLYDGLYFPWDKDNKMARKMCDLMDIDVYDCREFILEGGSIHSNGCGTILTTEECLLGKGRNPKKTKEEIEQHLKDYLGAEKVIWLKRGVYNDETNGHIDNICAFTSETDVVLLWTDDKSDPQYEISKECLEILEKETDAKGRKINVHKVPMPQPILMNEYDCQGLIDFDNEPTRTTGERLAGSYINFYIANDAIIMPIFNDPNDEKAINIISSLFPTREVVPIYAKDILIGGGNIHCITQQIPL